MSTTSSAQALSVDSLNKSYGSFEVLKNLDLILNRGSILGLVGLNGSGKTTTIECILGLQNFNSGAVSLFDYSPSTLHQAKGKIVGIFDTPSLHPNLTVRQSLQHAALLTDNQARSPERVEELLSIEKFSNFKIRHLSLGNKRRASLAHALLSNPDLIVLDEPFNGLDAGGVDDVLALIQRLNQEEGTTFLLSSHQLPYLENICSHIAILHQGAIAVSGTIDSLLEDSKHTVLLRTEENVAAINYLQGREDVAVTNPDADGYIQLEITELNSADLNRQLIENNIAVSELILQKASLSNLFRTITSNPGEQQS
ncbi:MAG: ATP-binding cassette domain-containing protein [Pseudomonadales bacterium]|nr:ATP-binding cassette domain-containing protein [Pseudomonadales bacterium]